MKDARKPTAVIADDERLMREQIAARLKEAWPELDIVGEAASGREAVALVRARGPDIVFLGIRMPEMQHKRRSPQLATLKQRMARIAAVLGDRDGQLSWLKEAFDVDRKNPEIAAELAQLATEVGDYDLALKPLRAITLMDDPQPITRVMAFLWEAKIEHARGNTAKAELWARKALREDPHYADAQAFLDQITQ